jgi:hypothetical protein
MVSSPPDGSGAKAQTAFAQKYAKLSEPSPVTPDSTPFRYGPEINHGRSDAPINAAAQARKEALAMAPSPALRKKISIRPARYISTRYVRPAPSAAPAVSMPIGYVPSVPPTGQ